MDTSLSIAERYLKFRSEIPPQVRIVVAVKGRTAREILEILEAGATDMGENYVQEAEDLIRGIGGAAKKARWHMIGALQKNKINRALKLFDVLQTIGSKEEADALEKRLPVSGRETLAAYIEINSGSELSKSGAKPDPETVLDLARHVASCPHLRLEGVMTMGPAGSNPEALRPCFRQVRMIYDAIGRLGLFGREAGVLSMGMSDSYREAIEEGANMIRVGQLLFGPRERAQT